MPVPPNMETTNPIEALTAKFLKTCDDAGESEQRVVERLTQRLHISRNVHQEFEESLNARPAPRRSHRDVWRVLDVHPHFPVAPARLDRAEHDRARARRQAVRRLSVHLPQPDPVNAR